MKKNRDQDPKITQEECNMINAEALIQQVQHVLNENSVMKAQIVELRKEVSRLVVAETKRTQRDALIKAGFPIDQLPD